MPGKAALSSRGTRRYIIMRIYAFDVARVCVARVCGWRKKEENKNIIVEGKRQSVRWKMRNVREREKESEGGRRRADAGQTARGWEWMLRSGWRSVFPERTS